LPTYTLLLVSTDANALRSVEDYLVNFGARLSSTARLSETARVAEEANADAVILFADDYTPAEVRTTVRALSSRLAVIVATRRADYDDLTTELPSVVTILPRPLWGWVLLDTVRAGVSRIGR
jgi:DNA-binding response OmpR family regulator